MRLGRTDESRSRIDTPDITSMVDVVFLLIIFFLTTSSLVELTKAQLDLPREAGEEERAVEAAGLVVNITAEGGYIVDQEPVTFDELLRKIGVEIENEGDPEMVEVLVRADRAAPLEHVNTLARALLDTGVRSWRLATEVPLAAGAQP